MSLSEKLLFSARVPSARRVTAVHLVVETRHVWCCCFARKRSTPLVTLFVDAERQRNNHGAVQEFGECRFTVNTEMLEQVDERSVVKMKVKSRAKTVLKYFIDATSLIERLQNHSKFRRLHITLNAFDRSTAMPAVEVTHELAAPTVKSERPTHATRPRLRVSERTSERAAKRSVLATRQQQESLTASITPKYEASPGQYEARLIIWSVAQVSQSAARQSFPHLYFKVRMSNPRGQWRLTDIHHNCVNSQALFNYRIVLPPFSYPAPPRNASLSGREHTVPPTLDIVMMDSDKHTRDDCMGRLKLNLQHVCVPDQLACCGINTLTNKRVNLFDASAVQPFRDSKAVFPRELTGYWPITMRSKITKRAKRGQTGSVLMTVQLLTAQEAAEHPAVQGNRSHPHNRHPTLLKPDRKHANFRNLLVFRCLQKFEQLHFYVTGIPTLKMGFWVYVTLGYLAPNILRLESQQAKALAVPVGTFVSITLVCYYVISWILQKTRSSFSEKPQDCGFSHKTSVDKCKHFLSYLECEECCSKLDGKRYKRIEEMEDKEWDRMQKERRKRVKALNDQLFQEINEADKADKPRRSPKIRFDLEDLPLPIKDRELLYEDYQESGSSMLEQWDSRLQELRGNERALTEELESMATSWMPQKGSDSSDKPQDHHMSSQKTRGHVKETRPTGQSHHQSAVSLWRENELSSTKCEHFLFYLKCVECRSKLNRKQRKRIKKMQWKKSIRRLKARRKYVKALNKQLIQENKKADKGDKPQRNPKIRFDLEGLPLPIKERELLFKDYQSSRSPMLEQWDNRLKKLRGNERALMEELESMASSVRSTHLSRGQPTRLGRSRVSGGRCGWGMCFSVVFASMFVLAVLFLPRLPEQWTPPITTLPPEPRAFKDDTDNLLKALAMLVGTYVFIIAICYYMLSWMLQKGSHSSDKPQDHMSSQKTRGHVRATCPTGKSYNQLAVSLWRETELSSTTCEHFLFYLDCDECRSKVNSKQRKRIKKMQLKEKSRMLKERRKRVKALNKQLIQENKKADKGDKPQRSPKIHFDLEGLPLPIKERELLYEDYDESGTGMVEQWSSRMQELRGDERALTEELETMANKPLTRLGPSSKSAGRCGWCTFFSVVYAFMFVFAVLSLTRQSKKIHSTITILPPEPRGLKDAAETTKRWHDASQPGAWTD